MSATADWLRAELAADRDRHYVGFELNDSYESGFRRELRQIKEGGRR